MIKSMTAFSQAAATHGTITADVTVKSVNSRHLDIFFYSPDSCQVFEDAVKKKIAQFHERGRVEVRLYIQDTAGELEQFDADLDKAASYYKALKSIHQHLGLKGDVSFEQVLSAKNLVIPAVVESDPEILEKAVMEAVSTASEQLGLMKEAEGRHLNDDLNHRVDIIEKRLEEVRAVADQIPEVYREKLLERIERLTRDTGVIDPVRINQEAAILADKGDITEEIIRLESHIKQFRDILKAPGAQGKKLNFLIQEFNREFNTIGSKSGNARLSHIVVDLKSELEKIREQVQNIE